MAGTVTFNGTNITLAESGDSANWDDDGSGPGSGQSADLPIQGAEARGRRVDNADKGSSYDNGSGIDLSAEGQHVGYWVVSLQPAAVTRGSVKLGGGSDAETSPTNEYDRFDGTNPYPKLGGWQRVWLEVARVADTTTGTLNHASIRQFGHKFNMADVGGTTPNVQQDRTDRHAGAGESPYLTVDGGTAPSPATIQDFVTADIENSSNVYGGVYTNESGVVVHCRLGIADATATIYVDDGEVVTFGVQPLAAKNWMGFLVDLQNSSTDVEMKNGVVQSSPGATILGDLDVRDTTGVAFDTSAQQFRTLRRVKLNSKCTLADATTIASCGQIDPTNGDYNGEEDLAGVDEYVDTQENVDLNSTSGDLELIMRIAPDDWTPTAIEALASHYGGTIATESIRLQLLTTGALRLIVSDGSAESTLDSSVIAAIDGHWRWVRVEYDQSTGGADFYISNDPADTPVGDIEWTASGTPTGTSRSIPTLSRPFLVGAENDGTPTAFFAGKVAYCELWTDGFEGAGDLLFSADWRTGPDFTTATRSDDFDTSGITWEEHGTTIVYTQGDDNTGAADLDGVIVRASSSVSGLVWNVNADPNGELDSMQFVSAGTGHAMTFGALSPATISLTGHSYTGYAGTDGSTGNETIYVRRKSGTFTINVLGGGDTPTVRTEGATIVKNNTVAVKVTARDADTLGVLQNAAVLLLADTGGPMPSDVTVTATQTAGTATVSHASHGRTTGDVIQIVGANEGEYNGIHTITVTGAGTYTYPIDSGAGSPATGTLKATSVILCGLTNASGVYQDTGFNFVSTQPVKGKALKGSSSPAYRPAGLTGSIVSGTGYDQVALMGSDE